MKDIKPVREHTLQARAFHVTREAARQKHDLTEYFERYDLDGSGVVRASEFTAASTASGFFFSLSECRWLAEKFKMRGVSDGVDYKSFSCGRRKVLRVCRLLATNFVLWWPTWRGKRAIWILVLF